MKPFIEILNKLIGVLRHGNKLINLTVLGGMVVIVGITVNALEKQTNLQGRAEIVSTQVVTSGAAGPGQVFEPRPGVSCSLSQASPNCMHFVDTGLYCQQLCCGYTSFTKAGGFVCHPNPPGDAPPVDLEIAQSPSCTADPGVGQDTSLLVNSYGSLLSNNYGKGYYTIQISDSNNFSKYIFRYVVEDWSTTDYFHIGKIEFGFNQTSNKYYIKDFDFSKWSSPSFESFEFEQGKQYYMRINNGKDSQVLTFQLPNCNNPTNPSSGKGFLMNTNSLTMDNNQAKRGFMYRGIANQYLDTKLIVPYFAGGSYGYYSSLYLSNPNSTTTQVDLSFHMTPYFECDDYRTVTQSIFIGPFATKEITVDSLEVLKNVKDITPRTPSCKSSRRRYSAIVTSTQKLAGAVLTWRDPRFIPYDISSPDSYNLNPVDIEAEPVLPSRLVDSTIYNNQLFCRYGNSTGYFDSGHWILNASDKDQAVTLVIADQWGTTLAERHTTIPALATLDIYGPILMEGLRLGPTPQLPDLSDRCFVDGITRNGFTGSLSISTDNNTKSLVGSYTISRIKDTTTLVNTLDQDQSSSGAISPQDSTACSYEFPLYDQTVLSNSWGVFNTGIAVRSGFDYKTSPSSQETGEIKVDYYSQSGGDPSTKTYESLSGLGLKQLYMPNLGLPTGFNNNVAAARICAASGSKISTSDNARREAQAAADYIGFGDWGFSDNWISNRFVLPYFVYRDPSKNRAFQSKVHFFNPSDTETLTIKIGFFGLSGGIEPTYPPATITLRPHQYTNLLPSQFGIPNSLNTAIGQLIAVTSDRSWDGSNQESVCAKGDGSEANCKAISGCGFYVCTSTCWPLGTPNTKACSARSTTSVTSKKNFGLGLGWFNPFTGEQQTPEFPSSPTPQQSSTTTSSGNSGLLNFGDLLNTLLKFFGVQK